MGAKKKPRKRLSQSLRDEVMHESGRLCCVCHSIYTAVQIHHIDKNRDNNTKGNLAVLCLNCHSRAHSKGGFGANLTPSEIRRHKKEWLKRVEENRNKAVQHATSIGYARGDMFEVDRYRNRDSLFLLINSLPQARKTMRNTLQPRFDTGVTASMVQAGTDYIYIMLDSAISLADYYDASSLQGMSPQDFIRSQYESRQEWCRGVCYPDSPENTGTINSVIASGFMMDQVDSMIEDLVNGLTMMDMDSGFSLRDWKDEWRDEDFLTIRKKTRSIKWGVQSFWRSLPYKYRMRLSFLKRWLWHK